MAAADFVGNTRGALSKGVADDVNDLGDEAKPKRGCGAHDIENLKISLSHLQFFATFITTFTPPQLKTSKNL